MIIVTSPKNLPADALRAVLVKDEAEAKSKATEYQSTWFYQCGKIVYLYILNSEWEELLENVILESEDLPNLQELALKAQVELTQILDIKNEAQARLVELGMTMPCGHFARYAVNREDGTQYCCMCVLEADKQTIANLVMVDVEETNEKCPFCQTRAILARVSELLDLTPEIGSPLYDDVIADLINDTSSASSTFQCYCEETKHE
jgi:hypothetical protein